MRGYYIENFGCRATQADGSAIERQLVDIGMHRVTAPSDAEIIVLNTCTVTSAADQDARAAVRRVHRQQPGAKVLVTGCYAQRAPEELSELEGVTWVVGNTHKHRIGNIIAGEGTNALLPAAALQSKPGLLQPFQAKIYSSDIFAHTELKAAPVFDGIERTRPNLKIQDGCNNRCSFCVIPFVRGQSRSLSRDDIFRELESLQRAGYREIVISGINLGRWGRDLQNPETFHHLLRQILDRTSIEKVRLSSVEPMDWTDDLIGLMASSCRIASHAHVPLQSGSDTILRTMHRKYRPWHYAEKIEKIRKAMPDAAIGADVMVGFPGESDSRFEESRVFIESLPFTYLHVFTYSPRPGTPAAGLPLQVPIGQARERNRMLREVAAAKNLAFRQTLMGRTVEAITLSQTHQNGTEALTDNYLKLDVRGQHRRNEWIRAKIEGITEEGLSGSV